MKFDPDVLLAALPRRVIHTLPLGTKIPGRRSFGDMSEYNGFSGRERLRTHGVSKWLRSLQAMTHEGDCELCGKQTDQLHAENYFDLTTWLNLCRGCHGSLHKRFSQPHKWQERLDLHSVAEGHWARLISDVPIDLAELLKQRGAKEPGYSDFVDPTPIVS